MFGNLFKKAKEILVDHTADVQRVNCVNLVPPLEKVKRWHCDMGDGREGDCFIFLKKEKCCRFHDPKYIPLSEEEIIEKVLDETERRKYVANCLAVEICPDCGHDLKVISDDDHGLDDGHCPICQKTYPL